MSHFRHIHSYVFIFLLMLSACGESETTTGVVVPRPVKYDMVRQSNGSNTQNFSGIAQSNKVSQLSFRVAGTVNKVNVEIGDRIRKGQLIASMDPTDYQVSYDQALAQLRQSETQLVSAETQLITSKSSYQRIERLYENNSVPLSEYEQARSSYETAQAQFVSAKAQINASNQQVKAAKNQLDYTRIIAPFSGVISDIRIEENELVNAGSPIAVLNAEGKTEVLVGLPEAFITKLKVNAKASVRFTAIPRKSFTCTVKEVGFNSNNSTTYPVIVSIDNITDEIRPGMAAEVSFSFKAPSRNDQSYAIVPVNAVAQTPEGTFVFQLEKNDTHYIVKKNNVEIGELLAEGFELKSGLKVGDTIATAGIKTLFDGMEVTLY